jgi:hypothetical protein
MKPSIVLYIYNYKLLATHAQSNLERLFLLLKEYVYIDFPFKTVLGGSVHLLLLCCILKLFENKGYLDWCH